MELDKLFLKDPCLKNIKLKYQEEESNEESLKNVKFM